MEQFIGMRLIVKMKNTTIIGTLQRINQKKRIMYFKSLAPYGKDEILEISVMDIENLEIYGGQVRTTLEEHEELPLNTVQDTEKDDNTERKTNTGKKHEYQGLFVDRKNFEQILGETIRVYGPTKFQMIEQGMAGFVNIILDHIKKKNIHAEKRHGFEHAPAKMGDNRKEKSLNEWPAEENRITGFLFIVNDSFYSQIAFSTARALYNQGYDVLVHIVQKQLSLDTELLLSFYEKIGGKTVDKFDSIKDRIVVDCTCAQNAESLLGNHMLIFLDDFVDQKVESIKTMFVDFGFLTRNIDSFSGSVYLCNIGLPYPLLAKYNIDVSSKFRRLVLKIK